MDSRSTQCYMMPMLLVFFRWITTAVVIAVTPYIVEGIHVSSFGSALAVAIVLSFLNLLVRPILILLTLPLTLVSLGFFLLVINALILQLASALVSGFAVDSFWAAFLGSLLITLVSWLLGIKQWKNRPSISVKYSRNPSVRHSAQDEVIDLQQSPDGHWR